MKMNRVSICEFQTKVRSLYFLIALKVTSSSVVCTIKLNYLIDRNKTLVSIRRILCRLSVTGLIQPPAPYYSIIMSANSRMLSFPQLDLQCSDSTRRRSIYTDYYVETRSRWMGRRAGVREVAHTSRRAPLHPAALPVMDGPSPPPLQSRCAMIKCSPGGG